MKDWSVSSKCSTWQRHRRHTTLCFGKCCHIMQRKVVAMDHNYYILLNVIKCSTCCLLVIQSTRSSLFKNTSRIRCPYQTSPPPIIFLRRPFNINNSTCKKSQQAWLKLLLSYKPIIYWFPTTVPAVLQSSTTKIQSYSKVLKSLHRAGCMQWQEMRWSFGITLYSTLWVGPWKP